MAASDGDPLTERDREERSATNGGGKRQVTSRHSLWLHSSISEQDYDRRPDRQLIQAD